MYGLKLETELHSGSNSKYVFLISGILVLTLIVKTQYDKHKIIQVNEKYGPELEIELHYGRNSKHFFLISGILVSSI